MANLLELAAVLTLDSSKYKSGLADAESSMESTAKKTESVGSKLKSGITTAAKWGAAITGAATAAGAGVVAMASKTAANADEVDKMSIKLGLSREAYQKWDYVLSQAGTDINSMGAGIKKMTTELSSVTDEASFSSSAFAELGMSYDDIKGKSREEVFASTITALQNCQDETQRAALANDIFGKSGQNLAPLLASGAASTEELMQKAKDLGLVLSDDAIDAGVNFTDTMDTLKRSFTAVGDTLGGTLLPYVSDFANWLIDTGVPNLQSFITEFKENWLPVIEDVATKIGNTLGPALSDMADFVTDCVNGLSDLFKWLNDNKTAIENVAIALSPLLALFLAYQGYIAICNVLVPIFTALETAHATVTGILTGAQVALNAAIAFMTSPIGLVILAITAVIAAGVLLYKNWDKIKKAAGTLWKDIKKKFENIYKAIKSPFDKAVKFVKNCIDKIKGFFKFKFSWPNLTLPHFTIKPSGWKIGDLLKGKIPTLGIKWYAEAMDNPIALNGATLFGAANGQLLGGGETGTEYITGKEGIQEAVAEVLDHMNLAVVLDSGELVGRLTAKIDKSLGAQQTRTLRGL